ncbi:hypothetical protein EV121DRAFT_274500 [Schizophyllum commune]
MPPVLLSVADGTATFRDWGATRTITSEHISKDFSASGAVREHDDGLSDTRRPRLLAHPAWVPIPSADKPTPNSTIPSLSRIASTVIRPGNTQPSILPTPRNVQPTNDEIDAAGTISRHATHCHSKCDATTGCSPTRRFEDPKSPKDCAGILGSPEACVRPVGRDMRIFASLCNPPTAGGMRGASRTKDAIIERRENAETLVYRDDAASLP